MISGTGTTQSFCGGTRLGTAAAYDACARATFTEALAQVPARRRTTTRLRTQIGRDIGEAARSVVEVADGAGVSWPTAHAAFVPHAEQVLGDPAPVVVLGIDETRRGKPRWTRDRVSGRWIRTDPWDTGFVDLAGDQRRLCADSVPHPRTSVHSV